MKTIFAVIVSLVMAVPGMAPAAEPGDGAHRIDVAGRQRMLSQRLSKALCLKEAGIDAAVHLAMAKAAWTEFDSVLNGLIDGDPALHLVAETDHAVLASLFEVVQLWNDFGLATQLGTEGPMSPGAFAELHANNVPLLQAMDRSVKAFEANYGGSSISAKLASTINIAGAQRMLTQKAVKEMCMIHKGLDVEADRASLRATLERFNTALAGLQVGDAAAGMLAPPTPEIAAQLDLVATHWAEVLPALDAVAEGAAPAPETLGMVAKISENVLFEMNRAVQMYSAN